MVLTLSLTACTADDAVYTGLRGVIDITGSNTVTPLTTLFAEELMHENSHLNISVAGPGSGAGIAGIINGTTDIGQSSRPMRQSEYDLARTRGIDIHEFLIALDALAVIVHPDNPVNELSIEQLSGIYTGIIDNWAQVGGHDAPIIALSRDTNSGTHVYFKETVVQMQGLPAQNIHLEYGGMVQMLPSTSTGVTQVSQNPNAIFYAGLGYLGGSVKTLGIKIRIQDNAVKPSLENTLSGTYAIARGLYYYTNGKPSGLVAEFIEFAYSSRGQQLVQESGFVPVKLVSE